MAKKKEAEPIDFSQESLAGFETVTPDDLGTPFLKILQKLSPELDEENPKYNEALEAGSIVNSITAEPYGGKGEPVTFIACVYQKMFVEWTPREQGGGFIMAHKDPSILDQCKRDSMGKDVMRNDNIIVTTAYVLGFVVRPDATLVRCVISFTSTQLKKSRQWLAMAMNIKLDGPDGKFTPPLYSHKYNVSTVPEKNDKGSWYGWKIENAGLLDTPQYVGEAREAHKQITSGKTPLGISAGRSQEDEGTHDRF